tara:strand:+ start:2706 stop:2918 length:213 start_codon:yes stop_codon:yes gene_type:complete
MSTEATKERVSPFTQVNDFTQDQAVRVLIQIAQLAQAKGILSMDDAVYAAKAIEVFVTPPEKEENTNEKG